MPRPPVNWITFTIDGREVSSPENLMLVDAAKYGDVEIPVFCYEPKLGQPVGACRMCLVEIEGIPKLQTGCSTPVKDGMVVHTQTARVHEAQRAVVEFLLINHPLDCPVCDKGGECPLQDITYGWGPGTSRFIEPKRHFRKPLELSPLIAIDRERCILCYRCVRFSQEVSEDYQLILSERGAHSYVSTFDGHPYVGPFSGNIVELCPVGALTSTAYRFRARPWDIEGAGTICTYCPSQCNVELTVRDDRVMRVLGRDNEEVDDGWLCDKGRFAYQSTHVDERIVEPLVREGGQLMRASWEKALDAAGGALGKAGAKAAALAGGDTTNEEAFLLQRLFREQLGSNHLAGVAARELDAELSRALAAPALQAGVPDLEFAHAVLVLDCDPVDDAPILDLRLRKGARRRGVRLAVASARPGALDPNAEAVLRFAPGAGEALLVGLDAALAGDDGNLGGAATAAGSNATAVRELAEFLSGAGSDVVILYGERLLAGPRGAAAARALLNVAARLGLADHDGAGLLEIPAAANGRGIREAGFAAAHGPGYADAGSAGLSATAVAGALADGDVSVLYLLGADPIRDLPDRARWEAALGKAQLVIAHAATLSDTVREHADVVFPAEAYAEKEGTLVHPDGRLQRLRAAIGRPKGSSGTLGSGVRPGWQVIADVASRAGLDLGVAAGPMASRQLFESVSFYRGLTLDAIGGTGVRWPVSEAASALAVDAWQPVAADVPARPAGRRRRAAPARHLALALGRAGGRPVARAALPAAAPDGGALAGRRRPARGARRRAGRGRVQRHARARGGAAAGLDPERRGLPRRGHARGPGERAHVAARGRRARRRPGRAARRDRRAGHARGRGRVRGAGQRRARHPAGSTGRTERGRRGMTTVVGLVGYYEPWWIQILKSLIIFALVFQLVPIVLLAERKVLGRFQHRYGPNRVGPFGMFQPMADIGKLLFKEQFRPNNSIGWMFALAPAISMLTAVAVMALIPFSDTHNIFGTDVGFYGIDPSIGLLYAFAFGGLAFYGLMLGGWASGGKYAFLGSMRAAAQLISYEVAQGLSVVGVVMMAGSLSLTEIVNAQSGDGNLWFFIPQIVGFIIFLVSGFAETNRPPFDLPEADAELVQGYITEYGGGRFASFFAAEYLNIIVVSALTATLFLGGWNVPFVDLPAFADPLVVLVKTLALVFFFLWVRATLPRLRYDQLMSLGWKIFLPVATLNALVTATLVVLW